MAHLLTTTACTLFVSTLILLAFQSILSGLYPEQTVQEPHATQLQATRLVDDAFIRICDMVNDSSMTVRAKVS